MCIYVICSMSSRITCAYASYTFMYVDCCVNKCVHKLYKLTAVYGAMLVHPRCADIDNAGPPVGILFQPNHL